jgi:transcriptional regulator GlxA family with amidase domain
MANSGASIRMSVMLEAHEIILMTNPGRRSADGAREGKRPRHGVGMPDSRIPPGIAEVYGDTLRASAIATARQAKALTPAQRSALTRDVERMLDFATERAFGPRINVKVLKAGCAARDNNVSSRFKIEVGVYVVDYIASLRTDAAQWLLTKTSWPIATVAYAVGYEYLQTFYKDFRRIVACTPGAYRRACKAHGPVSDV